MTSLQITASLGTSSHRAESLSGLLHQGYFSRAAFHGFRCPSFLLRRLGVSIPSSRKTLLLPPPPKLPRMTLLSVLQACSHPIMLHQLDVCVFSWAWSLHLLSGPHGVWCMQLDTSIFVPVGYAMVPLFLSLFPWVLSLALWEKSWPSRGDSSCGDRVWLLQFLTCHPVASSGQQPWGPAKGICSEQAGA